MIRWWGHLLPLALLTLGPGCSLEMAHPLEISPSASAIRPTDGTGWNNNGYGEVTVAHWDTPGGEFRLHYTLEGSHKVPAVDGDGSGTPDFVEKFGLVFDEVYQAEVTALGLRPPPSDADYHDRPDHGGDGRFDVYLQNTMKGADGYVVVEACIPDSPAQCLGYMVVENDFAGYSYPTAHDGMEVLASHEFFHVVLNGYDVGLPRTFTEATAVWATERVFPHQNDFERFLPAFFKSPERPLDHELGSPADSFPYGLAIWPTFLGERHGEGLIAAVLEELVSGSAPASDLEAIDRVLGRDLGSSLDEAFGTFALWNLLTGDRSAGFAGYAAAATFPQLALRPVAGALPLRITDEIAYLSARYYRLAVPRGITVRVASERPQARLALHLVAWPAPGEAPLVVSAAPDGEPPSIRSPGEVLIVAASTARKDRQLPLSLAVTEVPDETPPVDPPSPPEPEPEPGDAGGCGITGEHVSAPWSPLLPLLLLLLLGIGARRSTFHLLLGRLARRSPLPLLIIIALGGPACREGAHPTDDGPDLGPGTDASGGDLLPRPDGPQVLAVGAFTDFVADESGVVLGGTPTSGSGEERYLLLLLSGDTAPLTDHPYQASLQAGAAAARAALPPSAPPVSGPARRCTFTERLRGVLAGKPRRLWNPTYSTAAYNPPEVGELRTFSVSGQSITAEALLVDGTTAFWIDRTTQPPAAIDAATLQELANGFSGIVVPRERVYFGKESDLDDDGHISILLSPLVAQSAVAFFSPCDLVDPGLVPSCGASNGMELLYMTPPSAIDPPYNTPTALLETAAHELQHAIYFYRKYLLNDNVGAVENPYLTEGLSALAQDLAGYQAGNLYVVMATLKEIDLIAVPNLVDPAIHSYIPGSGDGVMRGGGYLLLRYLFDRAGGDLLDAAGQPVDQGGLTWLKALVAARETGVASLEQSTQLGLPQIAEQFWTALVLSNRGPDGASLGTDPHLSYRPTATDPLTGRQRGCDLFAAFHGFQLAGPATQPLDAADGKLRAGGGELLTLKASPGENHLRFRIETTPAALAQVRLIRIK